jgi:hypothetical protein
LKVPRSGFYGGFILLLALFPAFIGGCELVNTSLTDYFLDNSEIVRVTGFDVKTEHVLKDGAILIPPGETTVIAIALANPRSLGVKQELAGAPEGKAITLRQSGLTELELTIAGVEEGEDYELTLALQSADGLRDFPSYPLRTRCVSFETKLGNFAVNGATLPSFDPEQAAFGVNIPYSQSTAVFAGTTAHSGATIALYAGADDAGEPLATGTHRVETEQALEVGDNDFYVKITAPSLSVQGYVVTVYRASASETGIGDFYFVINGKSYGCGPGAEPESGSILDNAIRITVPYGTDTGALSATARYTGDAIAPDPGAAKSYANPVNYTVTAREGRPRTYTVTVTVAPNSVSDAAKAITAFNILTPASVEGAIDEGAKTITVTVPYGTDLTAMTATASHTGASISPDPATARSYADPATFTVTATDGAAQTYTVTATVAKIASLTAVNGNFAAPNGVKQTGGSVSGADIKNTITAVTGTDSLGTAVTLEAGDYSVEDLAGVVAGTTATATLKVPGSKTSDGADAYKDFAVYVKDDAREIKEFYFDIDSRQYGFGDGTESDSWKTEGNTIIVTVPYGTALDSLVPVLEVSAGASSNPASGTAWGSGDTKTYTVTAEDGSTGTYAVTVRAAKIENISYAYFADGFKKTGSDISAAIKAAITSVEAYDSLGRPVTLDPADYSVDALIPAIAGNYQYATLRVPGSKTSNGADKTWDFSVYISGDTKAITEFRITDPVDITGTINETLKTITVTVPYGTDLSGMKALVSHTGDSISSDPEAARSYAGQVEYTVTAEDGTTATYTVTVTAPGIVITVTAPENLTVLTFSASTAAATPGGTITLTISGGATPAAWRVYSDGSEISATATGDTVTFAAPGTQGFYSISVIATVGEIDYSGSFELIVQ